MRLPKFKGSLTNFPKLKFSLNINELLISYLTELKNMFWWTVKPHEMVDGHVGVPQGSTLGPLFLCFVCILMTYLKFVLLL